MPREASKVRGWEKERRNRLNEGFASLAKVLPTYDPSVNLSKIAILTKATCAIEQLQNELNKIISPNASDKSTKDDIVKKLQKRIKKLLVRNEQLNNLLRDAEISVPTVVGTVRKFPRKLPWSKRISPDQAKILQKNEMEKENISSKLVQGQKKKMSVSKANEVFKSSMRKSEKIGLKKKKNVITPSNSCVYILTQPSAVSGLNRPCFFIENPSTTTTKSKINKSGSQKTPVINTTFPFINPTIPYLGPGTLILANGTVMPILSQPQVVVPQSVKIPNVDELNIPKHLQANNQTPIKKNGLSEGKKHIAIRPKHCVTKTNQVNKVPIPALTSRYANSYFFINGTVTNRICERGKNKVLQIGKRKALSLERKAVKRKNDDNTDCIPKKNKINDSVFKNATDAAEIEFEASQNNHLTVSKTSDTTKKATETSDTTSTIINTSPETVSSESKLSVDEKPVPSSESLTENCGSKITLSVEEVHDKASKPNKGNDLVSQCDSTNLIPSILPTVKIEPSSTMQTSTTNIPEGLKENNISKESMTHGDLRNESNSAKIFSSTKQNSDTSTPEEIRPIQSSDTCTTTSITQSLTTSTHEDTIKNLELNLVHSELSNDIFASLQVPPGCQNPESTSPTAAFLLAFPLVSSVKVTEIIDEDNSESQRGTPTLLQIGTIDSTKSTHTDTLAGGLLAFDSFFNNKDVCSSFYNSYPGEVKKAFEFVENKQSNSSVEMTNASSRVCEEVKVDEKVQAPKNKSLELMYHSKMPREYTKLAESANDKKLDDKFKRIAGTPRDTFNEPILTSAATNSDKKDTKKNYHKIFNENPADQNIGDGKSIEKNLNTKIMDDNNCRKKLVLESNDDNTVKQETFKQNVEEKNNIQTFQGTSHEILKCQMKIGNNITVKKNQKDVFDNDLKVICDSFPSNGVSNIHHIPQENENKLPKEITGNFNKPSMNVYVSAPNTNSFKTALTTPTSGTVGKIHEKGCANSSNEISHLYERKVVSSNFPNIYHNSKDNRNINFNLNYTNNTTPLLEKVGGTHYNNFPSKFSERTEIVQNPTRNCEGSVSANINYNIGLTNIPKDTPSNRKYTTERVTDLRGVDSNINSKITIDQLQRNSKQPENINYNMFEVTHTGMLKDVPVTISNNIGQIRSIDSNISLKANDHQQRHASKKTDDIPYNIFEVTGGSEKCAHLKSINSNINSETTVGHRQQYNSKKQDVHHNIFELATNVPKEIPVSMGNGTEKTLNIKISDSSKATADVPPQGSTKKSGDIYLKSSGQKSQCYFSTSYSDASCSFNHRTDSTRIYPTGSYMNLNKSCPNPLYTNCTNYNYSYPETTFQNYYTPAISRSETKSHYSLSYENYQEHKRVDTSTFASKCYGNTSNYIKDGKTPSDKDKCLGQSKTVNWMTTPDNKIQPPEPFLPAFTNQSYSFASCNTGETVESGIIEPKKATDLPLVPEEKQFSWSPTKLPNFLDTTPNFVTPTLPTLVGDLALGNPLTFSEQKPECKYPKEAKRKNVAYENQGNFLSVSQLVDHNKTERVTTRRNSGNRSKNTMHMKNKKSPKNDHDKVSQVKSTPNNYNMLGINDMFYDQKNRNSTKASSSYSAEALIGNQVPETSKKYSSNSIKQVGSSNFLTENIINYFPPVEDNYVTQNPSNIHHSFQNNAYNVNTFVYTTPVVSTTQVSSNFELGHEYAQDHFGALGNAALKDKTKNYRPSNNKDDKNVNYADNMKRPRKKQTYESNNINFEYPLLSMPGSTNSPILPDDFHSHTNFLPPTTPYSSKNSLYQRQGNEFNPNPLLSLTGLPRNNSQHPDTSSLMNPVGTSLTNFNLSTIFPEINKGATSNIYPDNRNKEHSGSQQGSFNIDQKYTFPG